mgnify:FL=1
MRAVIQRVSRAEITIDHRETRTIGQGLVVFLGVMKGDTQAQADFMAEKVHGLRIFTDENGKMNLSLEDVDGELLVVSNFTLGTDCKKGRRPSFDLAAPPQVGEALYRRFVERAKELGIHKVETGEFGAHMDVLAANDGPVTIIIDTERIGK